MHLRKLMLLLLLSGLTLMACAQTLTTTTLTQPSSSNPLCIEDGPIRYSATLDRPVTVEAVREHNAAWAAVCGAQK